MGKPNYLFIRKQNSSMRVGKTVEEVPSWHLNPWRYSKLGWTVLSNQIQLHLLQGHGCIRWPLTRMANAKFQIAL